MYKVKFWYIDTSYNEKTYKPKRKLKRIKLNDVISFFDTGIIARKNFYKVSEIDFMLKPDEEKSEPEHIRFVTDNIFFLRIKLKKHLKP